MFEINHLYTVDINGETAVRFLGENLRAAEVIGSRYSVLGLRGSDSVGIVGKCKMAFPSRQGVMTIIGDRSLG